MLGVFADWGADYYSDWHQVWLKNSVNWNAVSTHPTLDSCPDLQYRDFVIGYSEADADTLCSKATKKNPSYLVDKRGVEMC